MRREGVESKKFRETFAKVGLGSRERKKESWAILKESLVWAYGPASASIAGVHAGSHGGVAVRRRLGTQRRPVSMRIDTVFADSR